MSESIDRQQQRDILLDWNIRQACRRDVSFRTLALSWASSFGIAAGTGPVPIGRADTVMFKASLALAPPQALGLNAAR